MSKVAQSILLIAIFAIVAAQAQLGTWVIGMTQPDLSDAWDDMYEHYARQMRVVYEILFPVKDKSMKTHLYTNSRKKAHNPPNDRDWKVYEKKKSVENPDEIEYFDPKIHRKEKRLLPSINMCQNGGVQIPIIQRQFFCDNQQVTRAEYTQTKVANSSSNCITKNVTEQACVCPAGFTGYQCRYRVRITCNIHIVDPVEFNGCREGKNDSVYYMYSIPGDDPCVFADIETGLDVRIKLNCTSQDATLDEDYLDLVATPNVSSFHFNYAINTPTLKSLSPFTANIYFDYLSMKWLSQKQTDSVSVSDPLQLTGVELINMHLNLTNAKDYYAGGRLYYEYYLSSSSVVSSTYSGFIEDKNYIEPAYYVPYKFKWGWLVFALVIVALIGIAGYVCWRRRKWRQFKEKLAE